MTWFLLLLCNHYANVHVCVPFILAFNKSDNARTKRNLIFSYAIPTHTRASWAFRGIGDTCVTSIGILGSCQTFKACYPYFKAPKYSHLNVHSNEFWILANSDSCLYHMEDGRQAFGVCCTNPVEATEEPPTDENTDDQKFESPFQTGVFAGMAWPPTIPPLPTHPPDHTGLINFFKLFKLNKIQFSCNSPSKLRSHNAASFWRSHNINNSSNNNNLGYETNNNATSFFHCHNSFNWWIKWNSEWLILFWLRCKKWQLGNDTNFKFKWLIEF